MSSEDSDAKTLQQLEDELEVAFREGEVGETALLAWEFKARFPSESGVASIYIKKLLRDPYVAGISLEDFKNKSIKLTLFYIVAALKDNLITEEEIKNIRFLKLLFNIL